MQVGGEAVVVRCAVQPWRAWWRVLVLAALVGFVTAVPAPLSAQQAMKPEGGAPPGDWGTTIVPPTQVPGRRALKKGPDPGGPAAPSAAPAPQKAVVPANRATAATVSGDLSRTRMTLDLTSETTFTIFRMADPFRVIIDLPTVEFELPAGTGREGQGLVAAFRFGLFAPGKARIVVDTKGPVRIANARVVRTETGPGSRLEIDFVASTPTEFAADEIAAAASGFDIEKAVNPPQEAPPEKSRTGRTRPLIVIDPGHGGIDSGAEGTHGLEKDLVLAVAKEIQKALVATRRYDVVMTRTSDVFVSLDQRVRISMQQSADLFLSVHADSLAAKELAQHVRGATLYVLSERASDDFARRMAEKENAADLLAGIRIDTAPGDTQVRNILIDLMRRESATLSSDFRGLLIETMRQRIALAREPARSAPFKVLRQPGSPAVLLELGYISNATDERLMSNEAWQRQVASAVTQAVGTYFKRWKGRHP